MYKHTLVLLVAVLSFSACRCFALPGGVVDINQELQTDSEYPWFETGTYSTTADSSYRSADIDDYGLSSISIEVDGPQTISFDWKVSSEYTYDFLIFYIDNIEEAAISGETTWATVTLEVTGSGPHTLKWTYDKDYSLSHGEDAGWIDNIRIAPPFTISGSPHDSFFPFGSNQSLTIETDANSPTINWYDASDDQLIQSGEEYAIEDFSPTDQGTYYVEITSGGSTRRTSNFSLIGFSINDMGTESFDPNSLNVSISNSSNHPWIFQADPDNPEGYLIQSPQTNAFDGESIFRITFPINAIISFDYKFVSPDSSDNFSIGSFYDDTIGANQNWTPYYSRVDETYNDLVLTFNSSSINTDSIISIRNLSILPWSVLDEDFSPNSFEGITTSPLNIKTPLPDVDYAIINNDSESIFNVFDPNITGNIKELELTGNALGAPFWFGSYNYAILPPTEQLDYDIFDLYDGNAELYRSPTASYTVIPESDLILIEEPESITIHEGDSIKIRYSIPPMNLSSDQSVRLVRIDDNFVLAENTTISGIFSIENSDPSYSGEYKIIADMFSETVESLSFKIDILQKASRESIEHQVEQGDLVITGLSHSGIALTALSNINVGTEILLSTNPFQYYQWNLYDENPNHGFQKIRFEENLSAGKTLWIPFQEDISLNVTKATIYLFQGTQDAPYFIFGLAYDGNGPLSSFVPDTLLESKTFYSWPTSLSDGNQWKASPAKETSFIATQLLELLAISPSEPDTLWTQSNQELSGNSLANLELEIESSSGIIEISNDRFSSSGNFGILRVPVIRWGGSDGQMSAEITSKDLSNNEILQSLNAAVAQSNVDYTPINKTLAWEDGESGIKYIDIQILKQPASDPTRRVFLLSIENETSVNDLATCIIANDVSEVSDLLAAIKILDINISSSFSFENGVFSSFEGEFTLFNKSLNPIQGIQLNFIQQNEFFEYVDEQPFLPETIDRNQNSRDKIGFGSPSLDEFESPQFFIQLIAKGKDGNPDIEILRSEIYRNINISFNFLGPTYARSSDQTQVKSTIGSSGPQLALIELYGPDDNDIGFLPGTTIGLEVIGTYRTGDIDTISRNFYNPDWRAEPSAIIDRNGYLRIPPDYEKASLAVTFSASIDAQSTDRETVSIDLPIAMKPTVTIQPTDTTVEIGETINFSVTATGAEPLTYSWEKSDVGTVANTRDFSIPKASVMDAGEYKVIVSNPVDSIESNTVIATVLFFELISQSTDQSRNLPASGAVFSLDIESNKNWSFSSLPDWIAVDPTSGYGTKTATFSILPNPTPEFREVAIEVGGVTHTISQVGISSENQELSYADWLRTFFSDEQIASLSNLEENEDYDGDQISNAIEKYLGLNPRHKNTLKLTTTERRGDQLIVKLNPDFSSYDFIIQESNDLEAWRNVTIEFDRAAGELKINTDSISERFYRIVYTVPAN